MIYAVIDTNVIVSAMMARRSDSATVKVLNAIRFGRIKTVYTPEIVEEYREVLSRGKFRFAPEDVQLTIDAIISNALLLKPHPSGERFSDESDRVFYEVALAGAETGTRLVTGNLRHYPISPIVVTPAQMVAILEETYGPDNNH